MGTKTKQTVTPYDPAAIKAGQNALNSGYAASQANMAKYSPSIDAAIGKIGQNIAAPPAYQTDARAQLDKTINGGFVGQNPWTEGLADLIAKRTQGNYNATYGAQGRSHGGMAALLSSQGVADALGNFYSGVYDQERGRQQQAIMAAPAFNQDEYTALNNLVPAANSQTMLPIQTAGAYAGGMGNLIAPYTTTTQKQSGLGAILAPALGLAGMVGGALMPGAGLSAGLLPGMGGLGGIIGTSAANIGGGVSMGRFLG